MDSFPNATYEHTKIEKSVTYHIPLYGNHQKLPILRFETIHRVLEIHIMSGSDIEIDAAPITETTMLYVTNMV